MGEEWFENLKQEFSTDDWPEFLSAEKHDSSCQLHLNVHSGIRWFTGHFPDQPVLAGVVQTHWAGELCRWIFGIEEEFRGMDNLKFQTVIVPDKTVSLSFEHDRNKNIVRFKYFDAEASYSEGKLAFSVV